MRLLPSHFGSVSRNTFTSVFIVSLFSLLPCLAQTTSSDVPLLVPSQDVKIEVKEINYVEQVEGLKITPDKKDKYRIAIVTIQIDKPAGRSVEVAAADLTLHYKFATGVEVSPCEGISAFNQTLNEDRAMKLFNQAGPGWVKQRTAVRATQATTVYMDAVFHMVEPTISEVWLCVGRPIKAEPFKTKGWTP